jgi:hypothetical protein
MKLPIKAALFSALILPGAGHWLLRKYPFAVTYSALSLVALLYVLGFVFGETQAIAQEIVDGKIPLNSDILSTFVNRIYLERPSEVKLASYGLALIWLISIVHAYFEARFTLSAKNERSS